MPKRLPLKSDFAVLDVKVGRSKVRRALTKGAKVEVVIRGTICGPWGGDDGTSQEFALDVASIRAVLR